MNSFKALSQIRLYTVKFTREKGKDRIIPRLERLKRIKKEVIKIDPNLISFFTAIKMIKSIEIEQPSLIQLNVEYDSLICNRKLQGFVNLPKPLKQDSKLLVFAQGKLAEEAKRLGADIVGGEELFKQIEEGSLNFNKCVCTIDMFSKVTKLARYLGPLGVMPTAKKGTVTDDLEGVISKINGLFEYKTNQDGYLSTPIANTSFTDLEIQGNMEAILVNIKVVTSAFVRKEFFKTISLSSTNTPPISLKDIIGKVKVPTIVN